MTKAAKARTTRSKAAALHPLSSPQAGFAWAASAAHIDMATPPREAAPR